MSREEELFRCKRCGAVAEKKKHLCKPEKTKVSKIKKKELKKPPCGGKN